MPKKKVTFGKQEKKNSEPIPLLITNFNLAQNIMNHSVKNLINNDVSIIKKEIGN